MKKRVLLMDPKDNVVIATENCDKGDSFELDGKTYEVNEEIRRGHKIAIRPIDNGQALIKYGEEVGRATADIKPGDWVHVHNIYDNSTEMGAEFAEKYRKGEV